MQRALWWTALTLMLVATALGGAVLLTLASTGVLRTAPPAWIVELPVGGQRVPVSVAGLLKVATLPGAARVLDGRRVRTRIGELAFERSVEGLVVRCAPCTLPAPQPASPPLLVLDRAEVALQRQGNEQHGVLRTGGAALDFRAVLEAEHIRVRWKMPPTSMAEVVHAMSSSVPEARFVRIEGTVAAQGTLLLPAATGSMGFDLRDLDVGGLGTEALQVGWFRQPCADSNGEPRIRVNGDGERGWLPLDRMGPYLAAAVLAAEDQRFAEHDGIDRTEIAAALSQLDGAPRRGASTLTQQLARTLYTGGERSAARKLRELLYATEMERTLGKARILELYLNTVDWGPGLCGARAAARTYFRKTPAQLTPIEAAWLAGILRHPHAAYAQQFVPRAPQRERAAAIVMQMRGFPRPERQRWSRATLAFPPAACTPAAGRCAASSEPQIPHAAPVAGEILPRVETVEVVDRQVGDRLGIGQAQIHGDAPAALRVRLQSAPVRDAAAAGTEVEAERVAAHVRRRGPRHVDAFAIVVVGPQRAVAATSGTAARGGGLRHWPELPADRSTQARAFDHRSLLVVSPALGALHGVWNVRRLPNGSVSVMSRVPHGIASMTGRA